MGQSKNIESFIQEARKIHGEKYDYSKVEYINNKTKICIVCPEHGEFWQTPKNHLHGSKCPKCAILGRSNKRALGLEAFLKKAKSMHGDKYDYSKVEYKNSQSKVCIICPEHGEFWQIASSHINGQGCPKCAGRFMNQDYFIEKAGSVHGNKYDYSKSIFTGVNNKVCIICPEHGEFWQTPHHHLYGYGCRKCSQTFLDKELFIQKAKAIHGEKYNYTKVEYINNHTKVCIICPEHGEFWQTPNSHLNERGCPVCGESHLEKEIKSILKEEGINYIYQYHDKTIFKQQSLDFYLPEQKIAIECQGEQHYCANFFKSKGIEYVEKHLEYVKELDEKKRKICLENGIQLIYFLPLKFLQYETNGIPCFTKTSEVISFIKSRY